MTLKPRFPVRFRGKHPIFGATKRTRFKSGGTRETERGVSATSSPYYVWWYALRLSDRYTSVCATGGRGRSKLDELFADFGDVHATDFRSWWREKGEKLFGEPPAPDTVHVVKLEDMDDYSEALASGQIALVSVPLFWDKKSILTAVRKLLVKMHPRKRGRRLSSEELSKSGSLYKLQHFKSLEAITRSLKVVEKRRLGKKLKELAGGNEQISSVSRRERMGKTIIENVEKGLFPVTRKATVRP